MPADEWINDGHVLVIEQDGGAPEEGDVRVSVECPGDGCRGGFVACERCEGSGRVYDDADDEHDCPECGATGWDGGKRTCWLTSGADVQDGLHAGEGNYVYEVGRWPIEHRSDGHFEDYFTEIRRVAPTPTVTHEPESGA